MTDDVTIKWVETELHELMTYDVFVNGEKIGQVAKIESVSWGRRWNGRGYYSDLCDNSAQPFVKINWTYRPFNPMNEEEDTRKGVVSTLVHNWRQSLKP